MRSMSTSGSPMQSRRGIASLSLMRLGTWCCTRRCTEPRTLRRRPSGLSSNLRFLSRTTVGTSFRPTASVACCWRPRFLSPRQCRRPSLRRRDLATKYAWRIQRIATKSPHTQLSGSYSRHTAIGTIPDVDVLLFVREDQLERTPNAVLLEVHKV